MFEKEVQILHFEFVRNFEVATPGDVVSSQPDPGSAWDIAFVNGADFGRGIVHEGIHFVLLHFNDAHDVIPLDGDVIGSTVFNNDLAILVVVNGDQ
jgi:hypothetical protein